MCWHPNFLGHFSKLSHINSFMGLDSMSFRGYKHRILTPYFHPPHLLEPRRLFWLARHRLYSREHTHYLLHEVRAGSCKIPYTSRFSADSRLSYRMFPVGRGIGLMAFARKAFQCRITEFGLVFIVSCRDGVGVGQFRRV